MNSPAFTEIRYECPVERVARITLARINSQEASGVRVFAAWKPRVFLVSAASSGPTKDRTSAMAASSLAVPNKHVDGISPSDDSRTVKCA